jgi:hypothetical protein
MKLSGLNVVLVAITAAACAPMPRVALQATPADLEMLAGDWRGEYQSAALGRRGRIEFRLKAGTDEAYGDVTMVPAGDVKPYQSDSSYESRHGSGQERSPELLTIKFIRASDGLITGMLDRYWDPDRQCFATTVFRGRLRAGAVEGTFTTTFECGAGEATGTWRAGKKPSERIQSADAE